MRFYFAAVLTLSMALVLAPVRSHAAESRGQQMTFLKDIEWKSVVAPDAEGRTIAVFMLYGNLGQEGPTSFLMKYSSGRRATPHSHSNDYYAVVVSGVFRHFLKSADESEAQMPGTSWYQKGNVVHDDYCEGPEDCILSVFFPEGFDVKFLDSK
jgi:hypothetical protein